jgi:hypothetical protein
VVFEEKLFVALVTYGLVLFSTTTPDTVVEPPELVYQSWAVTFPLMFLADNFKLDGPQLEVALVTAGVSGIVFTVKVNSFEVLLLGVAQVELLFKVTWHFTLSPLDQLEIPYVLEFDPTGAPFLYHW